MRKIKNKKFWLNGLYREEVRTYHELADVIIQDEINNNFNGEDKKLIIVGFQYMMHVDGFQQETFYEDLANHLFDSVLIWDGEINHRLNKRNDRYVRFIMTKHIESIHPEFLWEI